MTRSFPRIVACGALLLSLASVAPAAVTAVTDTFTDGDFTNNPSWTANAGSWSVVSGVLHQTSATGVFGSGTPPVLQLDGVSDSGPYIFQADVRVDSAAGNNAVGLAFNIQDADDFSAFIFFPGYTAGALQGAWREVRWINGVANYTPDGDMDFTSSLGAFYTMRLEVNGSSVTARVKNGTTTDGPFDFVHTYTDATFSGGGVGLISLGQPGRFDNVTLVPEPAGAALLGLGVLVLSRRRR
jgi:hypothetical protein